MKAIQFTRQRRINIWIKTGRAQVSRIALSSLILLLAVSSCSKKNDKGQAPPPPPDINGCLGYAAGASTVYGTLGQAGVYDFKNSQNDAFFAGEVNTQRSFWNGVSADVYVLYEPSQDYMNAYATPDGQILFGYDMFYYLVQKFSQISSDYASPLPVDGVLAHEWGHRVQFTYGWSYQANMYKELEADFFSGYYLGLAKQLYWSQIQTYYNAIYSVGDYAYASPQHHGTPQQRLNSAYTGLQVAVYALNNRVQYTYAQLHDLFNQNLSTIVSSPATTVTVPSHHRLFEEVSYPLQLNRTNIHQLFPTTKN